MTDDRNPDVPDDELPADAFDGLDLDSLTTGVHATADQWTSIATAASRRRHRRAWVVAAAAMVVLVVATAAVVLNREDTTDPVDVASGGVTETAQHLLPPAAAHDITAVTWSNGSTISYGLAESNFVLTEIGGVQNDDGTPLTEADLAAEASTAGSRAVDVPDRGRVWIACTEGAHALLVNGTIVATENEATATWFWAGTRYQLSRLPGGDLSCEEQVTNLRAKVSELVAIDEAGWRAFLADHPPQTSPDTSVDTVAPSTTTSTNRSTTTTSIDTAPAERGTAEQQIAAAVKGLMDRDADGSYSNLEDGRSRAGEYKAMFDLAATQSGADQVADPQEGPFALSSTTFTAPDRATISFDAAAHLPSGDYHFAVPGTALLQDGHWVISYDTIATMVGRACTPPGGVSKACGPQG